MQATVEKRPHLLDRRLFFSPGVRLETILYVAILIAAIFSRTYILGARVMSHDENSHVYYSWRFYQGQGFQHDPLMHGPIQFHLLALSYFMFGDNDFTGRLPQALCSIAAVGFLWFYRRDLGRVGALLGAGMMLISPYMLYYGRYARNEGFIQLFGVVTIWAILRYLESGRPRYLYWLTLASVLHFTSKETSFIYTAQAMIFLAGYFLYKVTGIQWPKPEYRTRFIAALIVLLLLISATGGYLYWKSLSTAPIDALAPATEVGMQTPAPTTAAAPAPELVGLIVLIAAAALTMGYFLLRGLTFEGLRSDRALGMVILLGTLVLPQLAAFPVRWMGWKIPTNAAQVASLTLTDIWHIAVFMIPMALLSVVIGVLWNRREWLINAAIWYGIFTVFYTSLFTHGAGFFTGMVGSLGYWLEQQGVERGNQPLYYYAFVQMPVYEYLPALGTLLGFGMVIWGAVRSWFDRADHHGAGDSANADAENFPDEPVGSALDREVVQSVEAASLSGLMSPADYSAADDEPFIGFEGELQPNPDIFPPVGEHQEPPVFALLGFWAVTSLLAFTYAGERMPWLTQHITFPAILAAAWAFGRLLEGTDWDLLRVRRGWLVLVLLPAFLLSMFASFGSLLGPNPPFQGQELAQLQGTSQFLTSFLFAIASGAGVFYLIRFWAAGQFTRYLSIGFFSLLAVLTARTAIQSSFYNYDQANELLVYAHSAPGVKTALDQIEEISRRTTDGLMLRVAYDNETSYPYWWYLRNYPNAQYYGSTPSKALREAPAILVGDANFGKIEPVVANLYYRFDYIRLWWPNQDYYDLTFERIRDALTNREMRTALFNIWMNRDYTLYGKVTGRDLSLPNWSPAARMRLYLRKDIASTLWSYGSSPASDIGMVDPFEEKFETYTAAQVIGMPGSAPGQLNRPRDIAVASDGSIYVVDTDNHRIQHLSPEGEPLHVWGGFGDATIGPAQGGLFNQPWGIGLGPDGSVYIADTWNHRIQKFTADGSFIRMWGYFGQGEQPDAFWGPRDVAVDAQGRVYVTDTGNKRVVIFDEEGRSLGQFGTAGLDPGQFDEPVGLAVDADNLIYVADTWNQRIQVFQESGTNQFIPFRTWDVQAWFGQSVDNKPYLTVGAGSVFAVDPEGYRILQFSLSGEAIRAWGDYGATLETFGLPAAAAVGPDDSVWVCDSANNRLMRFVFPGP